MSSGLIAAGITAAVAIGTTVYSTQQAKKAAKSAVGQPVDPVDLQSQQKQAVQGNLANQPDIEKLVASTNRFDQSQASSLMEQAMPGYKALSTSLGSQAQKLADNPYAVPEDVQNNLQRLAAEKGVSTGRTGQAGQFSLLRDLGVNQLQYGQSNLQTASGLTQMLASIAPKVNPMSPMSMYITPGQQNQNAENNADRTQGYNNAVAGANAAGITANANMWGQIGGAAAGFANSGALNGMLTSNANPSGMDTSKNGAVNDMVAAMNKNGR
jgi:hypothetical protein